MLQKLLELADARNIQHVRIMPAGISPFKAGHAPANHRLVMLEEMVGEALALVELESPVSVFIDTFEMEREGRSYTCETVEHLRSLGMDPVLVIGADNLSGFHRWKESQELMARTPLLVFLRHGISLEKVIEDRQSLMDSAEARSIEILDFFPPGCSSTELRQVLSREPGNSTVSEPGPLELHTSGVLDDCLSSPIRQYIHKHHLYRTTPSG